MITLTMSMQRRIYNAAPKVDQFFNDTVVDYSLQLDAYWQQLRDKMPKVLGKRATNNVVFVDFPPAEQKAEIIPSLETASQN